MAVTVYKLSGGFLNSSDWEFTFHGLSLEERTEQFMQEESYLTCKGKSRKLSYIYIPFHDIARIDVTE
nr:MAG TPA: hypothetical protein [Caudoviricetes sp.]